MENSPRPGTGHALSATRWRASQAAHEARADALTAGWRSRRAAGTTDPIEDFLFRYYPIKPGVLRRWHPGAGVRLEDATEIPRWYRAAPAGGIEVDVEAISTARATSIRFIRLLFRGTTDRTAHYGCFGLHEWAMVYQQDPDTVRHDSVPLRLGSSGTDAVVESHRIACSHYDAYRFFTPEAAPRNRLLPTRENQSEMEQAGCLHAGMDVYKWASKLGPLVPGSLLLDCFDLARDIRILDMRASPYDVRAWGYSPVPIETDAGKAEYVRQQRAFTERSNLLRARILAILDNLAEIPAMDLESNPAA